MSDGVYLRLRDWTDRAVIDVGLLLHKNIVDDRRNKAIHQWIRGRNDQGARAAHMTHFLDLPVDYVAAR